MVRKFLTAIILILVLCMVMIPSFAEIEGETIFGDLEGFDIVEGSDGIPLTLGTTFAVRVPGKITAVPSLF